MQIQSIEMKNFKQTESRTLHPAKFNVLIGPNGSGKTTVLEAVKCGLNGKPPADHIKAGTAGGYLTMDVTGLGVIERKWSGGKSTTKLNGRTTTQKSIIEMIQTQFGFSSKTTDIMSSSEVVENLFGKEFAQYLLDFLKNDMDFDKLVALCEASPEAVDELSMQLPPAPDVITLADIDEAYEYYKKVVTNTKAEISVLEAKALYEGIVPKRSAEEIDADIQSLSKKLGEWEAKRKSYATAKRNFDVNAAQIADLKKKIAAMTAVKPTEGELEATKALITSLREKMIHGESEAKKWQNEITRLSSIMEKLNEPICPISKALVCTTDKTTVRTELQEAIEKLQITAAENVKVSSDARKQLTAAEEKYNFLLQAENQVQAKAVLQEQLKKAQAADLTVPEMPDEALGKSISNTIEELHKEQKLAVRYREAMEARKRADVMIKRLAVYKELYDLLSPKGGARQKVLEHNIAPLQLYCNEKMERILPKYTMMMDVSNGFKILLSDAEGNMISYDALSNGEKIRILYILTDMLNALNHFRILILDDLDGLDEDGMTALVELLKERADDYDHIFLASVNTTEAKKAFDHLPKENTVVITM